MADAESILTARAVELEAIDNTVIGEVVGVSQSIGDLRKALDVLPHRAFLANDTEQSGALGYQDKPPPQLQNVSTALIDGHLAEGIQAALLHP